jgi:hypothetical protein
VTQSKTPYKILSVPFWEVTDVSEAYAASIFRAKKKNETAE